VRTDLAEAPQIHSETESRGLGSAGSISGFGAAHLLYVEDNPANMQLVEGTHCEGPDMRLITAVDGTLGIELARAAQPQVILMDINLPGISGFKALKILRGDAATAHIPVIALSANAMPRDIERGLEAGFFPLPHQTHSNQRVHGHAQRCPGICRKRAD